MNNDNGVYILITPSETDDSKAEYRVAYLDSNNNITWDIDQAGSCEACEPSKIKPYFTDATVYTFAGDANEEAYRIADNHYTTTPPVYRIYIETPYPKWGVTTYVKKEQDQ